MSDDYAEFRTTLLQGTYDPTQTAASGWREIATYNETTALRFAEGLGRALEAETLDEAKAVILAALAGATLCGYPAEATGGWLPIVEQLVADRAAA